jgi:hypothetical protein
MMILKTPWLASLSYRSCISLTFEPTPPGFARP